MAHWDFQHRHNLARKMARRYYGGIERIYPDDFGQVCALAALDDTVLDAHTLANAVAKHFIRFKREMGYVQHKDIYIIGTDNPLFRASLTDGVYRQGAERDLGEDMLATSLRKSISHNPARGFIEALSDVLERQRQKPRRRVRKPHVHVGDLAARQAEMRSRMAQKKGRRVGVTRSAL